MTELTDKQLKALAELLGGEQSRLQDFPAYRFEAHGISHFKMVSSFIDWLLGNDGQSALMDAVLDSNEEFTIGKLGNTGYRCMIEGYVLGTIPEATICKGGDSKVVKTRQEALINAVLDMLGAKTT